MIRQDFRRALPHGTLRGTVRIPEGPPPRYAVVLVHGFLGSHERDFLPWLADALASRYTVVSYTSPGSGIGASGTRTELHELASSTHTRELDELALVLELVERGDLCPRPPRGLALVGHGRGGAHALLHADRHGGVAALVTWAAPCELDRWNSETRATWRRDGLIHVPEPGSGRQLPLGVGLLDDTEAHRPALDPAAAAERLDVPWLVVQGGEDLVVDPDEARTLAAAGRAARLVLLPGGDHHLGGREPFTGAGPVLREALLATQAHLRRHLEV